MKALGVLALLVIVSATAGAQTPVNGTFHAASLQATGSSRIAADLVGLLVEDRGAGDATAGPAFELRAAEVLVERDTVQIAIGIDGGQPTWTGPSLAMDSYPDAVLVGTANRIGYRLNVQGGHASIESGCLDAHPSDAGRIQRNPRLQYEANRAPFTFETEAAVVVADCSSDATLVVRGDLKASLWQWDAVFGDSSELRTGYLTEPSSPEGSPTTVYAGPAQEAFLYAVGAELRIPLGQPSTYEIYVHGAQLESSGRLALRDGEVNLEGFEPFPRSSRLALDGDSSISLDGGSRLAGAYSGVLDGIEADGKPLSIAAQQQGPHYALVGVVAALLAALATWRLTVRHRRSPTEIYTLALRAHANELNRRALRLLGQVVGRGRGDGPFWELRARCHLALGELGKALAAYRIAYDRYPVESNDRELVARQLRAYDPKWAP